MFVRSRLSKDIVYRKKGNSWVIKAGTVTYIDENQVSAQELRELYSTRIAILSRDKLDKMEKEIPVKEVAKPKREHALKRNQKRTVDELLTEIKDEVKKEEVKDKEGCMTGTGSWIITELDKLTEIPIQVTLKEEPKLEIEKVPLKVTKDEVGDLVLEPVHAVIEQPVEIKKEPTHAGADLKIELDAVQPVEIKKEEPIEDKPKKGRKASTAKKTTGKKRGRKKSTAK